VALVLGVAVSAASGCSSPTAPTQPPVTPTEPRPTLAVTCPTNQTATATNGTGIAVTFAAPVVSGGVAPVQSSCSPASASLFPVGATTVRCTATDAAQASVSCSFTVSVAAPTPQLSRTKFLAFGDSLTAGEITQPGVSSTYGEGWGLFQPVVVPSVAYPTQLLSLLRTRYTRQNAQIQVTNAGQPGEWAEDGVRRLPGVLSAQRPEAVLLLEGINELAALGTPGIQRASRAVDTMAKEVRNRGARLFLATVAPTRGTSTVSASQVQSLNSLIRTTARGENAVLVDVYEALVTDVNRYIGIDGIHPTEAGYQKIAETFFAAIRADLEARNP
jgi:lysophospholipase L1-like esterase